MLDFLEPSPVFERFNGQALRAKSLSLTQGEARKLGIGKSTLHYLRERTKKQSHLTLYPNVRKKLECLF